MSISFIAVECPSCGANLSVENNRESFFCEYCGSKIIMHNENEHIIRNIDEARLKEAENERLIRLRELELEVKENEANRRHKAWTYGAAIGLIIFGIIACLISSTVGMMIILIGFMMAVYGSNNEQTQKKKRKYVGPNEAMISGAMEDYEDEPVTNMELLFKAAGFTNVRTVPIRDLNMFTQKRDGMVEQVTINGSNDFKEGDIFAKNSYVLITYHCR